MNPVDLGHSDRSVAAVSHDHMVQKGNAQKASGRGQTLGQRAVVVARCGIAAGMIVHDDHLRGAGLDRRCKHFPGVYRATGQCPARDALDPDPGPAHIEEQNPKRLDALVHELGPKVGGDVVRVADVIRGRALLEQSTVNADQGPRAEPRRPRQHRLQAAQVTAESGVEPTELVEPRQNGRARFAAKTERADQAQPVVVHAPRWCSNRASWTAEDAVPRRRPKIGRVRFSDPVRFWRRVRYTDRVPEYDLRVLDALGGAALAKRPIGAVVQSDELHPRERDLLARLEVDRRRLEWCAGRLCAARALAAVGGVGLCVLHDPRGAPTIEGRDAEHYSVAITHGRTTAAALAARLGKAELRVGLDLLDHEDRARLLKMKRRVFDTTERALIDRSDIAPLIIWGAKEALAKATRTGMWSFALSGVRVTAIGPRLVQTNIEGATVFFEEQDRGGVLVCAGVEASVADAIATRASASPKTP